MLFYKYPGSQVEYLDGKVYDVREGFDYDEESMLADGWGKSPDEAEAIASKAEAKPNGKTK